jgi:subtilase family serine protease
MARGQGRIDSMPPGIGKREEGRRRVPLRKARIAVGAATTLAALGLASAPVAARPLFKLYPRSSSKPPTTAQCLAKFHIACYNPHQFETAYNMKPLYRKGLTGKGETIVIVDSFGSPTVKSDLRTFDRAFGLPAPPSFKIIHPAGKIPKYNHKGTMAGWAEETSLDVQYAHSMAPKANLLLVETPVAETEGVHGFPQMIKAENYVINHHLGQVITQSFGATEQTFPSKQSIMKLRSAYKNAAKHHVTVLAASGDGGSTDYKKNGKDFYTHRVDSWPSTDPLVTSVGGTQLHLNQNGKRTAPDNVWNDTALFGSPAASGGGHSVVFSRPSFQKRVAKTVGPHRGTPDISMSAAVNGGAIVYFGFTGGTVKKKGWYIIGGTSEASPLFSGVVAVADQVAHHGLGRIDPTLYKLGDKGKSGIKDIVIGNNTVAFKQNGKAYTVPGFDAVPGYDLSSGLGTANGNVLVYQLAHKK